ncbi:MAG: hypothetical protein KatS3mg070_0022 [Meiothermus sp.]|uniref:transposase n=1 Tax=Meiothermus sp. TaxID=1955249 RepID=UPI0021DB9A3C|nr:transposase [Meiothermus sp.]GIW26659.1 MAG: hypothetical protein KatS3mg070_0022 [Meiothermus sp.]
MSLAPVAKYLQALLVAVSNHTRVGLADAVEGVCHDTFHRLLTGRIQLLAILQRLVNKLVQKGGYLILDDTTLQKFTTGLDCTHKVRDSKTGGFILGIQVLLVWTNGTITVPVGFHLYRGKEKHSKHELALQLLRQAQWLGIEPAYVLLDAWYASARLLHYLQEQGWPFVTRLRKNRSLNGRQLRYFRRGPYWSALRYLRGHIPVVVYRRGSKFYASSDLELQDSEAGVRLGGGKAEDGIVVPPSPHAGADGLPLPGSAEIPASYHPLQVATSAHLRQAQGLPA